MNYLLTKKELKRKWIDFKNKVNKKFFYKKMYYNQCVSVCHVIIEDLKLCFEKADISQSKYVYKQCDKTFCIVMEARFNHLKDYENFLENFNDVECIYNFMSRISSYYNMKLIIDVKCVDKMFIDGGLYMHKSFEKVGSVGGKRR